MRMIDLEDYFEEDLPTSPERERVMVMAAQPPAAPQSAPVWSYSQRQAHELAAMGGHLLIHGDPGSGKSTTQRTIWRALQRPHMADRLCYNKHTQKGERIALGGSSNIRTLSGLDWHIYSRNYGLRFQTWKPAYGKRHRLFLTLCAREFWPDPEGGASGQGYTMEQMQAMDDLGQVLKMVLATLFSPAKFDSPSEIDKACANWGIDLTNPAFVYQSLPKLMRWVVCGLDTPIEGSYWRVTDTYEFEDLTYQIATNPAIHVERRETLVVDEVQDMVTASWIVCRRRLGGPAYTPGERSPDTPGQFIGAGDPNQSIYRFRFVHPDMWGRVNNITGADQVHLNESYRLAHNLLPLPQAIVPTLRCHPDNEQGESREIDLADVISLVRPGHVMIFLTNAQGVRMTYYLIRNGIPALMIGTEIGVDMTKFLRMIAKLPGFSFADLPRILEEWATEQQAFIHRRYKIENVQRELDNLEERCACLLYLYSGAWDEGVRSTAQMIERIETLFVSEDDNHGNCAICMTYHKSKGQEYPTVYCEEADLNSQKSGSHIEAYKEHRRLLYVGLTRPQQRRFIIRDSRVVQNYRRMEIA